MDPTTTTSTTSTTSTTTSHDADTAGGTATHDADTAGGTATHDDPVEEMPPSDANAPSSASATNDMSTIRTVVNLIKASKRRGKSKKEVFHMMPDFCETYPTLFNMVYDDGDRMDNARLERMMDMVDQVNGGKLSFKKASEDVGQNMFNEYVKPRVPHMKKTTKDKGGFKPTVNFKNEMPSAEEIQRMVDSATK